MASKSLSFLLFGEDVTAGKAFKKVAADAEKSGGQIKGAFSGGSMLAIGGLAAGLGLAAKGAADFQTQMTRLVTAAGESQGNLKMVSAGVLSVSSATGTSLKATGDAMYYVESAGFHGAKGLEVLKAAAQGAKIEGADTHVVADALTTALTDLGKAAGPPATVMSQLVDTVAHGKMTMDDLAGSLHSVLPNAAKMGISFAQVAGAIATMTSQGISADQATQNLNHTIISLVNPTAVQTKTMAAFGLNSSIVARDIGKRGLTGTLQELSDTIISHMGPAGLTLTKALNSSQIAARKVTEGYKAMSPAAQQYYNDLVNGTKSTSLTTAGTKSLTLAQDTQVKQLVVLYKRAHGFSDLLKSGSPDALTYSAALAKATGGMTGLQVATHLTGDNMVTFKADVESVSKTTADAGGNVKDYALLQQTLNNQIDKMRIGAGNLEVELGGHLIPALTKATTFTLKHQKAVEYLVGGFVGLKVALVGYKLAQETVTATVGVTTAAQKLFGMTSAATAAQVEAAAAEEAAAVTASSEAQVTANEASAASARGVGAGAKVGAVGVGVLVAASYLAVRSADKFAERNNALAHTIDGLGTNTTNLTTAFVNNGGKVDANVRSIIAAQIAHSGLSDKAAKAGITTKQLTSAVMGSSGALAGLIQQWKASGKPSGDTITSLALLYAGYHKAQIGASNAAGAVNSLSFATSHLPKTVPLTLKLNGIAAAEYQLQLLARNRTANLSVNVAPHTTGVHSVGGVQVGFASGTDYVSRSGTYKVGEQGEESVYLPQGSRVSTATRTRNAGTGGGDLHVHVHVTQPLGTPPDIARAIVPAIAGYVQQGGHLPWR